MNAIDTRQIDALEALCLQIGETDEAKLSQLALAMNEDERFHPTVRSFALDAMLIAQGDFNGEFQSKEELLLVVQRLRKSRKSL